MYKTTKKYIAVIQAGGKGTRLRELTEDKIPKPLLALNGKPMIQWQMENLRKYGVENFVIITGHLGEKLEEYFGDGSRLGLRISYIREREPLGSAGALGLVKKQIGGEDVLLVFGDVMFDIHLPRMLAYHEKKGALATLLVHPNAHPQDSDLLKLDEEGRVIGFDPKNSVRDYWYDNCVNAGIYVLSQELLSTFQKPVRCDLEKDVLFPRIKEGRIFGYRTTEYVKDAGTVERFQTAEQDQASGLWEKKNLSNPQRCIFLDRDGTINRFKGLISREEELELEEGAAEAVRRINASGYLAIVITNQPVVARGLCSMEEVRGIHRKLGVLLGQQGAYLDDIIFCPHHPDKGYAGENPQYKMVCNCRKPATGMIDAMVEKYHIDREHSYMVGDSTLDIQAGKNAGLHTILVHTGQAGRDGKYRVQAEFEAENLVEAVKIANFTVHSS